MFVDLKYCPAAFYRPYLAGCTTEIESVFFALLKIIILLQMINTTRVKCTFRERSFNFIWAQRHFFLIEV